MSNLRTNRKKRLSALAVAVTFAFLSMFGLAAANVSTAVAEGTNITAVLAGNGWDLSSLYKKNDLDGEWKENKVIAVTLSENGVECDSEAVTVSGSTITIAQKGEYLLSGSWTGQIVIAEPENARVRLILNGVTIDSPEGPAIYGVSDGKLILTLADGTVNTVSDATAITVFDADGNEDTIAAAIWAENDISVNGGGALIVKGNAKHGIQCKSDLIIGGGEITITSTMDGLRGRNSVLVLDGSVTITAKGDGITSTRTEREDKGYVIIAGGSVSVTTTNSTGSTTINRPNTGDSNGAKSQNTVSAKGIKAETDLVILGGTVNLNTGDDALHANNVTVNGGDLTIASKDDGIHADDTLAISGGTIDISQSYEGLEACWILISGGETTVNASDDGLNATEGKSAGNGWDMFAVQDAGITVSGGTLHVSSVGDGFDSNGMILISGGLITVSGPTANFDAAVDFNGNCNITGGTLVAVGSSGMLEILNSASNQAALVMKVGTFSAGSTVRVLDSEGSELISFTPEKAYSSVILSTPDMQVGGTYTVMAGTSTIFSGTLDAAVTTSGNINQSFGNPGGSFGGPGGW